MSAIPSQPTILAADVAVAVLSDVTELVALEQTCFGEDSFNARQFRYLIQHAEGKFWVMRQKGRIVAYLSLLSRRNSQKLRIYSIAVSSENRGQGLGQKLLDVAFLYAQEHHFAVIALEVKVTNQNALALYRKNGFEIDYVIAEYYHDGSSAYHMQRFL